MILKNPDVDILFNDVCRNEQICIVLDGFSGPFELILLTEVYKYNINT